MTEETAPTMAASASTDRNTCRRLAPTTRNSANSPGRWPTVIENVLKIVNAPTKSEMKANTSNAVKKNERAWSTASVDSCTTVCPVTTSVPGCRARAMLCSTTALSAPGLATTLMQ